MMTPPPPAAPPHRVWRGRVALLLLVLVGAGAIAWGVTRLTHGLHLAREHELRLRETQGVITAVRALARLEAAEFHIERVIDLHDQQQALAGLLQAEDALLLVAAGDVVAGVDLAKLPPGAVQVQDGRAVLRLPEPEIFHVRLDDAHTYVYARRTDLLAQRDERLEGRARELAADGFVRQARQGGILDRARAQTERVVRGLLSPLGLREVVITFGPVKES